MIKHTRRDECQDVWQCLDCGEYIQTPIGSYVMDEEPECWECAIRKQSAKISRRKPHNQDTGYIASLRSGINRGWVVIYYAKEAGLDDADGKYAVVCQTHGTIVNTTSLPKARSAMKSVDFCEGCRGAEK